MLIYYTFYKLTTSYGPPKPLFLERYNFFFQAWWPDLPTSLRSGILIPTPPCPYRSFPTPFSLADGIISDNNNTVTHIISPPKLQTSSYWFSMQANFIVVESIEFISRRIWMIWSFNQPLYRDSRTLETGLGCRPSFAVITIAISTICLSFDGDHP